MKRLSSTVLITLALAACAAAPPNPNPRAEAPLKVAASIDLDRFMGRWYVIANIPYYGERGYVGSYVEYARRDDGRIDDLFIGHKGSFEAPLTTTRLIDTVVENTGNAMWKASPLWPLRFDFLILDVDADYSTALIGYPDKSLGWIFSRDPIMDEASYAANLAKLDAEGYDTSRFRRVPQRVGQVGVEGFQ